MRRRDPIIQALLDNSLTAAKLRAQNRLCNEREALIARVMTSGRWQGVLVKSLLALLAEEADPQLIKDLVAVLEWIDSTLDYFAEILAQIMASPSPGAVKNIQWDWDQFLLTYPGQTLWSLTPTKVDNYILPATGVNNAQ